MNLRPNKSRIDDKTISKPKLSFAEQVESKVNRKIKAQKNSATSAWFGLGMMGLIGWSIALPTILGAALGIWLDKHYKVQHSWTLALIFAGLTLGCFSAWNWLSKEDKAIGNNNQEDREGKND